MRIFLVVLGVLIALVLGAGAYVYQVAMGLEVVRITDDLHMIKGLGGNVGVLATGEGTVLVDTMTLEAQGAAIRETAEALTGEPVVMIINTHYHLEHTHGNPVSTTTAGRWTDLPLIGMLAARTKGEQAS